MKSSEYKITPEKIYAVTEGGKAVILNLYPQSATGFSGRRNFSIRGVDDKRPSCTVFEKDGIWFLQDKGGSDTKAYTAITLVQKEQGLTFPQALQWIAERFAPDLLSDSPGNYSGAPRADVSSAATQDETTVQPRNGGKFTNAELQLLGHEITQEICDAFGLKPLDSFITRKNAEGKSFRISANEHFPIYFYDYGTYGKIYQPLGDLRFQWTGKKPENLISGELEFMKMYGKAESSSEENPFIIPPDPEDDESEEQNLQWSELIICSGPSDALNVRRAGYHVCWLNSETADLSDFQFNILKKIAKKIYLLYDIDETGIANAYKIALKYLDISIINLPADLAEKRTAKGKPCKDAKDFFVHYRKPEIGNVDRLFDGLVRLSGGLKFWSEKPDKNGLRYDINNSQLYSFLQASGFFTIADAGNKYTYCQVRDNRVRLIDPTAISIRCIEYLQNYITSHPQYYKQALANAIFRSPQLQESSLKNLKRTEPNFDAFTKDADFFFFRNGIVKVTKEGVEKVSKFDCPYMIYEDKIIQHDFTIEPPLFTVNYSLEQAERLRRLSALSPGSPEYFSEKKAADAVSDEKKYSLSINRPDFDFLQFVYNTGRTYWQKAEQGYPLSDDEIREQDLNFISKAAMIGYMLSKYKDASKAYGVYAMEIESGDEGEHKGGTGKSLLMSSVEQLRNQVYVDGQGVQQDKMNFILQQVKKGITDTIYVDDLNNKVDLHRFMNWITGKMEVNGKYKDQFTLDYKEAPKVSFSSNHALWNFDNSLKRRTWFAAFSNYYHSDDDAEGLSFRSPETEFHRTLIQDYDAKDMNHFYNFMFNCIMVWKRYRVRIQPPMRRIEQRNLKKAMTDEFLFWAEDFFSEERLNCLVDRDETFNEYVNTLSKQNADKAKKETFKKKLRMFCMYKDWVFNPKALLRSDTEKKRCDIRKKIKGVDKYYFYIDTTKNEHLPVSLILGGDNPEEDSAPPPEDMPIF